MGRALPLENFRALAILEEKEPKMVEMLDRFEAERSDIILNDIQDTLRFMRLFGDVANLFFPVLVDTLVSGGEDEILSAEEAEDDDFWNDEEEENDPMDDDDQPKTPDQGGDIGGRPPGNGPKLS